MTKDFGRKKLSHKKNRQIEGCNRQFVGGYANFKKKPTTAEEAAATGIEKTWLARKKLTFFVILLHR